ncbi:probable blue pigment (indigoidine) exporter [Jatrophihabitans endophyticus]|uniref:Probable blue pigment (Indigoidine) exporter n=1 Tax=Jatrophihabitans endophyticus TaxID=1206085 RepID=A0A1M5RSZ5_9ACTN|nr:EamA family transporter [Jatrophihabitans endophyticus]SHH28923.1 probable blue pigment (indigoidine) exporter [Jatrophihabitans endophyticus]
MEASSLRVTAVTAVAPISWGSTYVVTRHLLPMDAPLWGATLRALPAGLLLLALCRRLPQESWWWRSFVLGAINFAAFFVLVYVAAQLLPSSVAASVMALAPLALGGFAFVLLGQRLDARFFLAAVTGVVGVALLVGLPTSGIDARGVAASVGALLLSAGGSVLSTRWRGDLPLLASTCWQLLAGGLLLLVAAALVEGTPPRLGPVGIVAVTYVSVVATAGAFCCWFFGLSRSTAGNVGLIGLLNPATGIALGVVLAGETLGPWQVVGAGLVLGAIVTTVTSRGGARQIGRPRPGRHEPR